MVCKSQAAIFNSLNPNIRLTLSTDIDDHYAEGGNVVLRGYNQALYAKYITLKRKGLYSANQAIKPIRVLIFESAFIWDVSLFFLWALILATPKMTYKKKSLHLLLGTFLLMIFTSMKFTYLVELSQGAAATSLWQTMSYYIGNNESYQEVFFILTLAVWLLIAVSKNTFSLKTQLLKT